MSIDKVYPIKIYWRRDYYKSKRFIKHATLEEIALTALEIDTMQILKGWICAVI